MMKKVEPEIGEPPFINRELSLLEFHARVLAEAQDLKNPLLERLKFISIVSSNLDEFFMVRVGSLGDQIEVGFNEPDYSGYTPQELLRCISERVHLLNRDQYQCFNQSLLPMLKEIGILFPAFDELNEKEKQYLNRYFIHTVLPVSTPIIVEGGDSFPLLHDRRINIALLLENDSDRDQLFATVELPSGLSRFIELPHSSSGRIKYILLEDLMKQYMKRLFKSHKILAMGSYRVTRNADLGYDEEGAEDLLEAIQESLKRRKWGSVVRFESEHSFDLRLLAVLMEQLELSESDVYKVKGPIDLTFLSSLTKLSSREDLKFAPQKPQIPKALRESKDIFASIAHEDILLHHPYHSFDPVLNLVKRAAEDPNVLSIQQTLYRVSGNSPIVEALARAAENGKQVTVLLELKARFDEENNIHWAIRLERAGCHVIYGLVGLKIHCKMLLIVRREETGLKPYLHLSTGNYNDVTAGLYVDIGLLTTDPTFCADASTIFNMLSGLPALNQVHKFTVAPLDLRKRFLMLIHEEVQHAEAGEAAHIVAKVNSLADTEIIESLYAASQAGVKIDLLVRGVCCLRPGIEGLSANITVRSIVGRYLEHSRFFYFLAGGEEKFYLSSADWMERNLDRRVEIIFPVESPAVKQEMKQIVELYLKDTAKTSILLADGRYLCLKAKGKKVFNVQTAFQRSSK